MFLYLLLYFCHKISNIDFFCYLSFIRTITSRINVFTDNRGYCFLMGFTLLLYTYYLIFNLFFSGDRMFTDTHTYTQTYKLTGRRTDFLKNYALRNLNV